MNGAPMNNGIYILQVTSFADPINIGKGVTGFTDRVIRGEYESWHQLRVGEHFNFSGCGNSRHYKMTGRICITEVTIDPAAEPSKCTGTFEFTGEPETITPKQATLW